MRKRVIVAAAAAALAVAAAGGGAAVAVAATAPAAAAQPVGNWTYACVKSTGALDYLEFKGLLPHPCNAGDALWRWPAVIPPPVKPSASATATS